MTLGLGGTPECLRAPTPSLVFNSLWVTRLVVIKEVARTAEYTWQEEHELECLRRLNGHQFRGHVIKLHRVFHKVDQNLVANLIVMESGICNLLQTPHNHIGFGTVTVMAWLRPLA